MFGKGGIEAVQRDTAFETDKARGIVNVDFEQARDVVEIDEPG